MRNLGKTLQKMVKSKDKVNQRFVNMYRTRKVKQNGLKFFSYVDESTQNDQIKSLREPS